MSTPLPELLRLLAQPEAWPGTPERVELVQTHISAVFLAGDRVLKIKKPVSLGFLDFSTRALRLAACEAEVRLNRRLAPDVYLGVVALADDGRGGLRLEERPPRGDEEPAVLMRRLPHERSLAGMLEQGTLDAATLQRVGRRLAAFHDAAEAGPEIQAASRWQPLSNVVRANLAQVEPFAGRTVEPALLDALRSETERELLALRPLVESRADRGMGRDGHGDLRLDHVYVLARTVHEGGAGWNQRCACHVGSGPLGGSTVAPRSDEVIASEGEADDRGDRSRSASYGEDRRPSPTMPSGASARRMRQLRELSGQDAPPPGDVIAIDCIEFRDDFRRGDPVGDVAFLCMELRFEGRADLADALFDAWAAARGDDEARALLPLNLCYRNVVRAKVRSIESLEPEVAPDARESAAARARAHFLAALVAIAPPSRRPALVLACGLPGAGKSTVARGLVREASFARVSSDETRKALAARPAAEMQHDGLDAGLYSPEWTDRTYAACLQACEELLLQGRRVVMDASFHESSRRATFLALARRLHAPCVVIECVVDDAEASRRLARRKGDASDADATIRLAMSSRWEPPRDDERASWRVLRSGPTAEADVAQATAMLQADGLA